MHRPRHALATLLAAATMVGGALLVAPAGSATAVTFVPAPTGVSATVLGWHQGADRVHVTWDPPADPVDHYLVVGTGGGSPAETDLTVPGDQTGADLDVFTAANPVYGNQLQFDVYAWSADSTRSGVSAPAATPSSLGAQLVGGIVSGVAGKGRISWPAPSPGDTLVLDQVTGSGDPFTTGTPVDIGDGVSAGSFDVATDARGETPQYVLFELAGGDPDQRSPGSYATGAAAPQPMGSVWETLSADGTSLQLSWTHPVGCPYAYWLTHCMEVRAVAKEGTTAPVSPDDGVAFAPALDQPGVENDGTVLHGLQPGHVYTVAVFNTPYTSLTDYSPPLALATVDDRLSPQLTLTGRYPVTVTYGAAVSLHLVATSPAGGAVIPGLAMSFLGANRYHRSATVARATTTSAGQAVVTFKPSFSESYVAQNTATGLYWSGDSGDPAPLIAVRPTLSLSLSHSTVRHGSTATFSGVIAPHLATTITLQDHTSTGWHRVTSVHATSAGRFTIHLRTTTRGTRAYRVERVGDGDLATGVSRTLHLTVT